MEWYVGNSNRFNEFLRNPPDPGLLATNEYVQQTQRDVDNLRAVIERSTLPEDVVLYRTTKLPGTVQKGDTFTDPGFLSGSIDPDFVEQFRRTHYSADTVVIATSIPAGTPVLLINNTFEREAVLLPATPIRADRIDGDMIQASLA